MKKLQNLLLIHPLYFAMLVFEICSGKTLIPLLYLFCLLTHESAHYFVAKMLGYKLNKICLMPYGAELKIDDDFINRNDEIIVALAGPLCNLAVCILLLALWWIFPVIYSYTEAYFRCNLALLSVNMLPLFPLDGGRVIKALIYNTNNIKKSKLLLFLLSLPFIVALISLAVVGMLKKQANLSLFIFLFFLIMSYFSFFSGNYKTIFNKLINTKKYKKKLKTKIITIPAKTPLYRIFRYYSPNYYLIFNIILNNNKNIFLSEQKILKLTDKHPADICFQDIFNLLL